MPKPYRAPNKRIIMRSGSGRFRRTTLGDVIGPDQVQHGKARCAGCGHEWFPLVKSGICPECGSQEKATPHWPQEILDLAAEYRDQPRMIDPRDHKTINRLTEIERRLQAAGYPLHG